MKSTDSIQYLEEIKKGLQPAAFNEYLLVFLLRWRRTTTTEELQFFSNYLDFLVIK